jgi:hypothetical protein
MIPFTLPTPEHEPDGTWVSLNPGPFGLFTAALFDEHGRMVDVFTASSAVEALTALANEHPNASYPRRSDG